MSINSKAKGKKGELWKDIKGYEGLYQVSNLGRIKNKRTSRKISLRRERYLSVYLYKNGVRKYEKVHRLVAITFIPNTNKKSQVNHIDGNRYNNVVENLEWCTPRENALHAMENKLFNINGLIQENNKKKIKVIKISNGTIYESINECARQNNTKASYIYRVCQGKRNHHRGERYSFYDYKVEKRY